MTSLKRKIGDIGEGIVAKYLENKGYKVLEKNYWKPWGEIDIVAEKSGVLCFIEVKSISRGTLGVRPEENMHPGKIKRLSRAIQTYLLDRKVPESTPWRLDLACVSLDFERRRASVEIFENAVL